MSICCETLFSTLLKNRSEEESNVKEEKKLKYKTCNNVTIERQTSTNLTSLPLYEVSEWSLKEIMQPMLLDLDFSVYKTTNI